MMTQLPLSPAPPATAPVVTNEMVVRVAQALCDEADPDVIDGAWVVSDTHYWALKAALDADAPGGG